MLVEIVFNPRMLVPCSPTWQWQRDRQRSAARCTPGRAACRSPWTGSTASPSPSDSELTSMKMTTMQLIEMLTRISPWPMKCLENITNIFKEPSPQRPPLCSQQPQVQCWASCLEQLWFGHQLGSPGSHHDHQQQWSQSWLWWLFDKTTLKKICNFLRYQEAMFASQWRP